MMGLVRRTVSPSSSIMRRSTPWVDGCWGPMLMIMVSSGLTSTLKSPGSTVTPSGRRSTAPCSRSSSADSVALRGAISWTPSEVSAARAAVSWSWVVMAGASRGLGRVLELHGDAAHGIVLAQRVALPVLGHQDAGEVGVAIEADAHHVEGLPLHGLRSRVEAEQRGDHGIADRDLYPQAGATPSLAGEEGDDELEALGPDAGGQAPSGVSQVVDDGQVHAEVEALVLEGLDHVAVLLPGGVEHLLAAGPGDRGPVDFLGRRHPGAVPVARRRLGGRRVGHG